MAQRLYMDLRDGSGLRDMTTFLYEMDQFTSAKKNEPTLFDFNIVPYDNPSVPWVTPVRGAFVEVWDDRWMSRDFGVPNGLIFTGYVTNEPEPRFLGVKGGEGYWAYRLQCTSEDFLANIHSCTPQVYVNKTRGFILKDMLLDMFPNGTFPFNMDGIKDGGVERIYQVETNRKWTEIAASFAKADGFVYHFINQCVFYQPECTWNSSPLTFAMNETDPRFNPDNVSLTRVNNSVVNDLTVVGLFEPAALVNEHWISDGYKGEQRLAYEPYGLEEQVLLEDDFASSLDESTWIIVQQHDPTPDPPNLSIFEGSLNAVGGTGSFGGTYMLSRRGVELTGVVDTRDGEIFFAPNATGEAILGGFYETDLPDANPWNGWKLNLVGVPRVIPMGDAGDEAVSFTLNLNHHYILRRQFTFTGTTTPTSRRGGSIVYNPTAQSRTVTVTWSVEEINYDVPSALVKNRTVVLTKSYADPPEYALYSPICQKDAHVVMNYITVRKPSQVTVTVDGVPQLVGSYLDGGACAVTAEGSSAKLAWYAVSGVPFESGEEVITTIPKTGALVNIQYRRKYISRARVRSQASIANEKQVFRDNGVRQKTLLAEEVIPSPRTTEECLLVARAYLADNRDPRWQGSYAFETVKDQATDTWCWPRPGDVVQCLIDFPDGTEYGTEVNQWLPVTNVSSTFAGKDAYRFTLEFGPVNRFEEAQRELQRRRRSSLGSDVEVKLEDAIIDETVEEEFTPPDPAGSITSVGTDSVDVTITNRSMVVIVDAEVYSEYEVRPYDSGWGGGGTTFDVTGPVSGNRIVLTLPRSSRDQSWYIRSYYEDASYGSPIRRFCQRPMLAHVVSGIAMPPAPEVTGVLGVSNAVLTIYRPNAFDLAGYIVERSGLVYKGDGQNTVSAALGVGVVFGPDGIAVTIPHDGLLSMTFIVRCYNLAGIEGESTEITITRESGGIGAGTPWSQTWFAEVPPVHSWTTTLAGVVPTGRVVIHHADKTGTTYYIVDGDFDWDAPSHTLTQGTAPDMTPLESLELFYESPVPESTKHVLTWSPFPLGGARDRSVECGTTPTPILDYNAYDAPDSFGAMVRVECKARQAGVTVTPSFFDLTAGLTVATGSPVTNVVFEFQEIPVVMTEGHQYCLRMVSDSVTGSAYAIGKLTV